MPKMYAEVNYESLALFGKFGGAMLGLLLLVWLIAILTPKAAKLIDRLAGKPQKRPADPSPERVRDNIDTENNENAAEDYKVYSVFEDRPKGAANGYDKSRENEKEKSENGKG